MKTRFVIFMTLVIFHSIVGMIITMIAPGSEQIFRMVMAGGDAVMFLLAVSRIFPQRSFSGVRLLAVFLLLSTITFLYTSERFGIIEHVNGIRESLYLFSAFIVVHDLYNSPMRATFARWMKWFLIIFAIVQTPVVVVQFLQYGASDYVGGTFGTRGGSGLVSQALFLICFYLIVRFASLADGSNFKIAQTLVFLPILIPCALNETKISFVLLGGMFVLMLLSRRQFYRAIPLLAIGGILGIVLNYYYFRTVEDTGDIFDPEYIEGYLFTAPTEMGGDLPRFQRMPLMFKLMKGDVGLYVLGMGYGVMGGGNVLGVSRLGRSLYYLVTGSRILLFRIWIQGGFLGVIVIAWLLFGSYFRRPRDLHTHRQFYRFLMFNLVIIWAYNEAILDRFYAPVFAFLLEWIIAGGREGEEEESAGMIGDSDLEPAQEIEEQDPQ